jgi:hypothetical protein
MLAQVDLSTTADTVIYTVPAGKRAAVSVSLCARSAACNVRIALTSGGAPGNASWIEFSTPLGVGGVLERGGIVLLAGHKLYAGTSVAGVSAVVWGIEETVA